MKRREKGMKLADLAVRQESLPGRCRLSGVSSSYYNAMPGPREYEKKKKEGDRIPLKLFFLATGIVETKLLSRVATQISGPARKWLIYRATFAVARGVIQALFLLNNTYIYIYINTKRRRIFCKGLSPLQPIVDALLQSHGERYLEESDSIRN